MPAPGSLLYSLQPYLTTEPDMDGRRNVSIYGVGDAKDALGIPHEHTSEDANLVLRVQEAQAVVERATGLNLYDTEVDMLFLNVNAAQIDALELSESDVKEVKQVFDVAATGQECELLQTKDENNKPLAEPKPLYNCVRANRRLYVQRTDGKFFRFGEGLVAKARIVRGIQRGTDLGHLVRAVMNMVVIELAKGIGMTSPTGFGENPTFRRLITMISSHTAGAMVV